MTERAIAPGILILLAMLLIYALCTACETAVDSLSEAARSRLSEESGDKTALLVVRITDNPEHFQSGVHLAALAAETVWFVFGTALLVPRFALPSAGAAAVSALILAALIWLLGRTVPRRAALSAPEKYARRLCPPFYSLTVILSPVTFLFLLLARGVLCLLHISTENETEDVSEDEIRAMVDIGQESGVIEEDEKEMIENVFEFNNMTARDVMIHRTVMKTVPLCAEKDEVLSLIRSTGLSRFPVYGKNADDILGILNTKDYLMNLQTEQPLPMEQLLRPAYFVPDSVRTDTLFRDMQSRAVQLAIVVDEYGGTSGLVTLEDLLEELVGNIYDEFDPRAEQKIIQLGENLWRVAGTAELEVLAEVLEIDLPEDEPEADTLGGLVFTCLNEIPDDDATPEVDVAGLHIKVEKMNDRRVEWAVVSKLPSKENTEEN